MALILLGFVCCGQVTHFYSALLRQSRDSPLITDAADWIIVISRAQLLARRRRPRQHRQTNRHESESGHKTQLHTHRVHSLSQRSTHRHTHNRPRCRDTQQLKQTSTVDWLFFSYRWWTQINAAAWSAQHDLHRLQSTSKLHIWTLKTHPLTFICEFICNVPTLLGFLCCFFVVCSRLVCRRMHSGLRSLKQCAAVTLCKRNLLFLLYGDYNVNIWWNDTTGAAGQPFCNRCKGGIFFLFLSSLRNFYGPGSYIGTCI